MDFIKRTVILERTLKTSDTDGDGIFDTISYKPSDKVIQVPIMQTFDDMGILSIYDDSPIEVIEITPQWRDIEFGTIDGSINCTTLSDAEIIESVWSDTEFEVSPGDTCVYCDDPNATNYEAGKNDCEPSFQRGIRTRCSDEEVPGCCEYDEPVGEESETGDVLEDTGNADDPLFDPDPEYDRTYYADPDSNCDLWNNANGVFSNQYSSFNTLNSGNGTGLIQQRAQQRCFALYPNNNGQVVPLFEEVEQFTCTDQLGFTRYNYIYRFKCIQ